MCRCADVWRMVTIVCLHTLDDCHPFLFSGLCVICDYCIRVCRVVISRSDLLSDKPVFTTNRTEYVTLHCIGKELFSLNELAI